VSLTIRGKVESGFGGRYALTPGFGRTVGRIVNLRWRASGLSLSRMNDVLRAAARGIRECTLIVVEDVKADRRR
jgi:hypothetical protein